MSKTYKITYKLNEDNKGRGAHFTGAELYTIEVNADDPRSAVLKLIEKVDGASLTSIEEA